MTGEIIIPAILLIAIMLSVAIKQYLDRRWWEDLAEEYYRECVELLDYIIKHDEGEICNAQDTSATQGPS